ncbi:hypothetical protein BH688_05675 [Kushneria phosphatilytica]|nr:hypothetical protein BH688_05675 [Kushneria phosphatilytica]
MIEFLLCVLYGTVFLYVGEIVFSSLRAYRKQQKDFEASCERRKAELRQQARLTSNKGRIA